jgi:hypothetical protein
MTTVATADGLRSPQACQAVRVTTMPTMAVLPRGREQARYDTFGTGTPRSTATMRRLRILYDFAACDPPGQQKAMLCETYHNAASNAGSEERRCDRKSFGGRRRAMSTIR